MPTMPSQMWAVLGLSVVGLVNGQGQCGTESSQTSMCRNAFINSLTDFCLFAPPNPGLDSTIGNTEKIEVAWCTRSGTGARLIPNGTITGAHFVKTPDFVQITGIGQLTNLNIPAGDEGGELDPHGADGNGNPLNGLVFSSAFGGQEQILEWTNFMSDSEFCFRACKPGPKAATFCQHIYDVMGCQWNMPGNYGGGFDQCAADSGEPMGVYGTSTFHQGQPSTPAAHPVPASSLCTATNTIGNGLAAGGGNVTPTPPTPPITTSSSAAAPASTTTSATNPSITLSATGSTTATHGTASVTPTPSVSLATTASTGLLTTPPAAPSTNVTITSPPAGTVTPASTPASSITTSTTTSSARTTVYFMSKLVLTGATGAFGMSLAGLLLI